MTEQDESDLLGPLGDFQVTEPGRYDIPDAVYHADPVPDPGSLSSTGAKTLLKSPAKFAHYRRFGSAPRLAFDEGSAAHMLVLGSGPELVKVVGTSAKGENAIQSNDRDRKLVAKIRSEGKIPLSPASWDLVHGMADALVANTEVAELLSGGTAEEAFFCKDAATGMWMRGKTDYRHADRILIDYKTSAKPVDPDTFERTMSSLGYHIQFAFYRHILVTLGLITPRRPFYVIAQEKEPPYLASVLRPDETAMAYGHAEAMRALELFQAGVFSNDWPGYPSEPQTVSLSGWLLRHYDLKGIEPVYTDRVGIALERIADCRSRSELSGVMIGFADVKDDPEVREAANGMWVQLGKAS